MPILSFLCGRVNVVQPFDLKTTNPVIYSELPVSLYYYDTGTLLRHRVYMYYLDTGITP